MEKIFSQINKSKLLHLIAHPVEKSGRGDIAPADQILQLASLRLDKGQKFRAHKHIWKKSPLSQVIAQESWVILQGKVKFFFYDIDDTLLGTSILEKGDCTMTFEGGHSYEILEDDTVVYEYKTGPYQGQKLDKVFIK